MAEEQAIPNDQGTGDLFGGEELGATYDQAMNDETSGELFPETKPEGEVEEKEQPEASEAVEGEVEESAEPKDDNAEPEGQEEVKEPEGDTDLEAPQSWRYDLKDKFKDLPEDIRKEIHRQEQTFKEGFDKYKESATFGNEMTEIAQPYESIIQSEGGDVKAAFKDYLQTAQRLRFSTEDDKAHIINWLVDRFKVDMSKHWGAPQTNNGDEAFNDPAIDALKQEIAQLKGGINTISQQSQAAQVAEQNRQMKAVEQEFEEFAKDPKHPHVEQVRETMAGLFKSGQVDTLEEAYDKACWMSEEVRNVLLADQAKAKVKKAIKTKGTNLKSVPDTSAKKTTWEEDLGNVYDQAIAK